MKTINNFIDEKLKLNKDSKIVTGNNTFEAGNKYEWSEVQNDNGKNWYYNTFQPSRIFKHGFININKDYEAVSLMTFDDYEDMCKDMGIDFDKEPDLENLEQFDTIEDKKTNTLYIKIW